MLFRSLLLLGVVTALGASPVLAAPRVEPAPATGQIVVPAATTPTAPVKKKKVAKKPAAKKKAKTLEEMTPAERAEFKAAEKKRLAAAAKAEAEKEKAAKAKLAAKAKAEKDKLAAVAKAEKDKLAALKAKEVEAKRVAKAKDDETKRIARAKDAEAKKKLAEEMRIAKAKLAEEKKKAAEDARLAKLKAAEDARIARLKAEEEARIARAKAAEDARQLELQQLASAEIAQTGNNGELRSEDVAQPATGLFGGMFSAPRAATMRPETRALDAALELKQAKKKKFVPAAEYVPQRVEFSGYPKGTIVIDTANHFLYLVESGSSARRYGIAVGKDGLQYKGQVVVGDKQEWPRWIPTKEMQERDPKKYGQYAEGMPGGGENPLGARAMYLYLGKKDTHLRIHGTIAPESIGTDSSNGCFRMINDHVIDLYKRVKLGTTVVVM